MSEKTETTQKDKVVEKVEFKFNNKTYKLGLDDKDEVINLFVVKRIDFFHYAGLAFAFLAVFAFIYDYFMDFGDNVKGFGIMWKGDYARGYAKSRGFTKKNVIRTVGKFILLFIAYFLITISQKELLVDNLSMIALFTNKDFVDVAERAYLDYKSKKNGSNKNKTIEKFDNSFFYRLKKNNKLV